MRFFDHAATQSALAFDRLVPALRDMFVAGCEVPTRDVHNIATADGGTGMTSLVMPAWRPGGYYGVKVVNIAPGNAARGLPGLHASYLLHDATTGVPLALMDGNQITARRTVAASALAASYLAAADAQHLLVVGAGRVAALLPQAFAQVRQIQRVSIWARNAHAARDMAQAFRQQGFDAEAAPDLAAAAAAADIVSCATLATEPVIQGRWLKAGSHLDLIGSFTPAMREADDNSFANADIYVDTEEALAKSGDLLQPLERGVIKRANVLASLQDLCRGHPVARASVAPRRTVFKAVGTALADLAAATLVMQLLR